MRTPIAAPFVVESLESRQLMSSTTPFLTNDCLPTGPASPPAAHHHRPTPGTVPGTRPVVVPSDTTVVGTWSGVANRFDITYTGAAKLVVTRSAAGDLFASLKFDRFNDTTVEVKTQFRLFSDGRFSLQSVSPKLVVKMDGTFNPSGGETGTMAGTFQYWTPKGTAKSNFNFYRQNSITLG